MNEKNRDEMGRFRMFVRRAIGLLDAGRIPECAEVLRELQPLRPDDARVPGAITAAASEIGTNGGSITILLRAVCRLPGSALLWTLLGLAFQCSGEEAQAQPALELALELDPDRPHSLISLAVCLMLQRRTPDRAERLLRRADELSPNDQFVWLCLGRALRDQGKRAEADQALMRAMEIDPESDLGRTVPVLRSLLAKERQALRAPLSNN